MARSQASTPEKKKLLKSARNRRCYEKKMRLQATRERLAAGNNARRRERVPGPLILSKNLSILNSDELRDLNARLQAWGFVDDHAAFVADVEESVLPVLGKKEQLRKWVRAQEDWLEEGKSLLAGMQQVITGTVLFELTPHEVGELFHSIMCTSYKVQYMMVGVEFALDKLGDV
ncbi:hypothetical protein K466DRAFT_601888 [Polyporus arcularius HHB13444]|uniref:Uncharacterized protein n=1 Tax=Polyporus arcularius HHB13444 TaxID=1314778 RepID=A0A5C3P4K3_9APHY|nr:hypothetical protein K466DRAFT_601888 [Polyporus arcularius HHB13444]